MDKALFERLLYEEESTTLDFKRDQYAFSKASEDEKSELLKDILGFANAWRRSDAYILIGVDDVRGGRSIVYGVSEHLPDHSLQQFVNSLTNRPLMFAYDAIEFDGKQVGVIRVELQQRPVYLRRDYGKLLKEKVYVRRGSSTDPSKPAGPDEIASMGAGNNSPPIASLAVTFADVDQDKSLGDRIAWSAEFCLTPNEKDVPDAKEPDDYVTFQGVRIPTFASIKMDAKVNSRFFREYANYEFCRRLFRKVRLVASNMGEVPSTEVRAEMSIPKANGIFLLKPSKFPEMPKLRVDRFDLIAMHRNDFALRQAFRDPGYVAIDANDFCYKVEIDFGSLQPGRQVWSDYFYIGIAATGVTEFKGKLMASNLPKAEEFTLTVDATVSESEMTVDDLVGLAYVADSKRSRETQEADND